LLFHLLFLLDAATCFSGYRLLAILFSSSRKKDRNTGRLSFLTLLAWNMQFLKDLNKEGDMIINEIEKGIAIPSVHSRYQYPWEVMEVNDSVLILAEKEESLDKLKRRVGPSARYYGNVTGKKFKTLLMREENGVRVWRTS
jgi:hypothetical protein